MNRKAIKIAPSILSADFGILGEEIAGVEKGGADLIHIDVMDGHFVPNLTVGPIVVKAARQITKLPLDVHLMIDNPDLYISKYVDAGSDYLTVHAEVCRHLHRTIQSIKGTGIKAGVALNPATSLTSIENIIDDIDFLLIMSVNPGFGGQTFIYNVLEKLRMAKTMIDNKGLSVELGVDGGVNLKNISDISSAGANMVVAGSAIFGSDNYEQIINNLRKAVVT
ncbi:MAG: ribulose-phosphate 3-epimerase [Nitrospirota bacterium]